jgi:hypothetical protein
VHRVLARTGEANDEVGLLAKALNHYFDKAKVNGFSRRDKIERRDVSKMLVDELNNDRLHMRQAAIDCLCLLYGIQNTKGRRLGYDPSDPADLRREKQKIWERYYKAEAQR